jgi:aldose 1-epimerase
MKILFNFFLLFLMAVSCKTPPAKTLSLPDIAVKEENFNKSIDGKEYTLFSLVNSNGMVVQLTNHGARIVSVLLPGEDGDYTDVVLGYNTIEEYLNDRINSGNIVGRFANRIARGRFELDAKIYQLEINNGENTLHSGASNYGKVRWDAIQQGNSVVMSYTSPDMEGGFPGDLDIKVIYILHDNNKLELTFEASTSAKTVINLVNHAYFNLAGEGSGDVSDQLICINADYITPVNEEIIPVGQYLPVENTPFDLRNEVPIGKMIDADHEQITLAKGYDHNWVINKENTGELRHAASSRDLGTGFQLNVYTTQPGLQFYTGNFMNGTVTGKSGSLYEFRNGFALEAQHFPDSPNQPSFPSTILEPGSIYRQTTIYEFIY